jgi:hypothetical protein
MKNRLLISSTPPASQAAPCNEALSSDIKKKETIEHDPLADPIEEMRTRNQRKMDEKNFKELQEAATELAATSARMSREIDAGGQYVVSLRVQNDLEQIEKLVKRVRSRSK